MKYVKKLMPTKAEVINIETLAGGVKRLTFQPARSFNFKAGQYVWVELRFDPKTDPRGTRRAFSIISSPNDKNIISIIARRGRSGYKQALFQLINGDKVIIHGPFGSSFVIDKHNYPSNIIMIAGGVGIAPFMPVIEHINKSKLSTRCHLIYLNQSKAKAALLPDLEKLKQNTSFLYVTVKYTAFDWTDVITGSNSIDEHTEYWVAGTQAMINQVYEILSKNGVNRTQIVFENYYPQLPGTLTLATIRRRVLNAGILAQTIQNSTNHTIITDPEGVVLFANNAANTMTGYGNEEIIGNTPRLWGGMMSPQFYRDLWKIKTSGETFVGELVNRRKNGEIYYCVVHISPIFDTAKSEKRLIGFIGTEEDVTNIKRSENRFQELNDRFSLATKSAKIGIWDWDVVNDVVTWDDQMFKLYGIKKADFSRKRYAWQKALYLDDRIAENEAIESALKGKKAFDITFRIVWPDGSIRYIKSFAAVEHDDNGQAIKMIGVNFDVTKDKEVDKAKTEFVSLASHQLRTPLGIIKWYLEALEKQTGTDKLSVQSASYVHEINHNNERLLSLVRNLLSVSRIDQGLVKNNPLPCNIVTVVKTVLRELAIMAKKKKVKMRLIIHAAHLPKVQIDELRLREVIENLVVNAIVYNKPSGSLAVTIDRSKKDFILGFSDSGYGISAKDQRQLFTKFFRTEKARISNTQGSGLGLYLVKSYTEAWGGRITVKSSEKKGSTFTLVIPLKPLNF
jgi:PAS domain S-box-containing protein